MPFEIGETVLLINEGNYGAEVLKVERTKKGIEYLVKPRFGKPKKVMEHDLGTYESVFD